MVQTHWIVAPQPAKGELALRRITNRHVASECDVSEHYVGRVLNGSVKPSKRFRERLAALLDMPEDALFREADT